jgi:NADPH:quinone reductase-like Zn-dependent oxidoreductase
MKAVVLTKPGGVENLKLTDLPIPQPGDHEVLVQTKAISINPVDAVVRGNEKFLNFVLQLQPGENPVILGWDISGVVTATGKSVTRFKKGDEVFGMIRFIGHGKAYAEYVTAPEDQLALKPGNVSHETAAAATLAAITAWQTLVTYAKIQKGDKVLIHSGAGGVGHYAIQLAKHFGATVIATSSPENKDFVLQLGADQHIDYKSRRFEEAVTDADIVLDPVSTPGHLDRSVAALKKGGRLISIVQHFTDEALLQKIKEKEIYAYRHGVASNGQDMEAIAGLLGTGDLHSHISQTFAFDQIPAAHQSVETGRTIGKIVVKL